MEATCSWWRQLFLDGRWELHAFACMRAWRFAILRKKHRFEILTPQRWQQVHFFEKELPLHAAIVAIDHSGAELDKQFELLTDIYARFPLSAERFDHQQHPALYYALEQQWCVEKLSWLIDKSMRIIMKSDAEGLSLITHAILNKSPEEVIISMAVTVARTCLTSLEQMVNERHFESARRFCKRILLQYLAGVPKFPHVLCRKRMSEQQDALVMIHDISAIWLEFVEKWEYTGIPVIQKNLLPILQVPIDSFVELSIIAKGEPLNYQWYYDVEAIDGATQPSLFVSQNIQPQNEGRYHCDIWNGKGSAQTTIMELCVMDDQVVDDPSQKYIINSEVLLGGGYVLHNISASLGGLLHHPATGVVLLLPPYCFRCADGDGNDLSESVGLDVALRCIPADDVPEISLSSGEQLVSRVIEIIPRAIGSLLRPATLWIPHSISITEDSLYRLDLVEISQNGETTLEPSASIRSDIGKIHNHNCVSCIDVTKFGAFAIVSRSIAFNLDVESPIEEVLVCLVRPKHITFQRFFEKIPVSIWITQNRPDCHVHTEWQISQYYLRRKNSFVSSAEALSWTIENYSLKLHHGDIVCFEIGDVDRVVYRWQQSSSNMNESKDSVQGTPHSLAAETTISPSLITETAMDEVLPAFCPIRINVLVRKLHSYSLRKFNEANLFDRTDTTQSVILSERTWRVLVPVVYNVPLILSSPMLRERSSSHLVLQFACNSTDTTGKQPKVLAEQLDEDEQTNRFEELSETEREFSPYFFVVEMAKFSETFWQRYDQTWWFDKTNATVIEAMYKTVHIGFEPFAIVATDAYAACFRVARCSLDHFGAYSEPYLLEPVAFSTKTEESYIDSTYSVKPSINDNLSVAWDSSMGFKASHDRLEQLLGSVYRTANYFQAMYGLPCELAAVRKALENYKTKFRAANRELALLLMGFSRVREQAVRIKLRTKWYVFLVSQISKLERLIPELDCSPVEYSDIIRQMHHLLQDLFSMLWKLSSSGWFSYFLTNEWLDVELNAVFHRIISLLTNDARGLRGASNLDQDFRSVLSDWDNLTKADQYATDTMRTYTMLVLGALKAEKAATEGISRIAQEVAHALRVSEREDDIAELSSELEAQSTRDAIAIVRQTDTLERHLLDVTPRDGECCHRIPDSIRLKLDVSICNMNTQQVMKVMNATLNRPIHGKVEFSCSDGQLIFTPSVAFEKKTKYTVKLRSQEIQTSLGSLNGVMAFQFTTPS